MRSRCFANILIIPKQLPSENTDAQYLRLNLFSRIPTSLRFSPASSMNTVVRSPFEGLTRICGHAIKIRLRKGLPRDRLPLPESRPSQTEIRRGQAQHSYFMSCSGSVFGTPAMGMPSPKKGVRKSSLAGKEALDTF
jgi:hypothetical protein